jgi:hypothetical protein
MNERVEFLMVRSALTRTSRPDDFAHQLEYLTSFLHVLRLHYRLMRHQEVYISLMLSLTPMPHLLIWIRDNSLFIFPFCDAVTIT